MLINDRLVLQYCRVPTQGQQQTAHCHAHPTGAGTPSKPDTYSWLILTLRAPGGVGSKILACREEQEHSTTSFDQHSAQRGTQCSD